MQKSRNKKPKSNSGSEKDIDNDNNINIDDQLEKNDLLDEDFNSDMSDEIEKKIDTIYERNKRSNLGKKENNFYNQDGKEEKKKKEKYEKKIMRNYFNDYFDASSNKIDDYYEVNYPELNKYELKIDLYTEYYKLIESGKIFPSFKEKKNKSKSKDKRKEDDEEKEGENYNDINKGNLFKLMYEFLYQNFNIFLYGFGSKMKLLYDFINYYQFNYNEESTTPLYIISFNLNNSEISMKVIINKIESCLMTEFEKYYGPENIKSFTTESTYLGQIMKINNIYEQIKKKFNQTNEEIEKDSSLEEDYEDEEEEDEKGKNNMKTEKEKDKEIKKNPNLVDADEEFIPFKILLVIHNLGSSTGQSKIFQENLGIVVNILKFVNLVVSCENLAIPYYWTSEVKDKFKFCFLQFNTFEPYDAEIDENNSIKGGNNLKGGEGLREILSSFTETQNKLIKEIAILTLKNEYDSLTPKGLIEYFVKTGKGIATDIQKLETLLLEAIDHEIVSLKLSNINNKEIYKMNLDHNIIQKIADGEYIQKA